MNLYELRHELSQILGDRLLVGSATAASTVTLKDTNELIQDDDSWNGANVYIYSGTGAGQERTISDFVQSTNQMTVTPAWATIPASGSCYEIHQTYNVLDGYNPAIRMAIRAKRRRMFLPKTDETVTLTTAYEYDIPSGFVSISEIWRNDAAGDFCEIVPQRDVRIDKGSRHLVFDKGVALAKGWIVAGRKLRIIGQSYETEPATETASISVNTVPILWYAKGMLHAGNGEDAQMASAIKLADIELADSETPMWPGSLFVEEV